MLESTSDSWADSRQKHEGEFLDICNYCDLPVYSNQSFAKRISGHGSGFYIHLACEDWYFEHAGEEE